LKLVPFEYICIYIYVYFNNFIKIDNTPSKIIESITIIFEFFLLCVFASYAFSRAEDIDLIHKHKNVPIEESDEEEEENHRRNVYENPNYSFYQNQPIISPQVTI
jgi:hypothetical protein